MESAAHVLVVDDVEANRDLLSRLLRRRGFAVSTASGGRAALDLIAANRYDLVILDLVMPDVGGLQVLQELRKTWSPTELPVIIATAKDESEDVVDGLKAGGNDYVIKPLDLPVVLARIQTQLSLKNAVDQIKHLERRLGERNQELEASNRDLTLANARMEREMRAAARIQMAMLPASLPQSPHASFAWLFEPCAEVAGDILNVFQLDEEHFGMYVLDVVGHGVAAALLSVAVSRVLSPTPNSFLIRPREDGEGYRLLPPSEVGNQLNRRFPWDSATEQFFTLLYGVLNVRTREFRFIRAGHPPPLYMPCNAVAPHPLASPGALPIGLGDENYEEQVVVLQPGDRIYFYSDGISEAMNRENQIFGTQPLLDSLGRSRGETLADSLSALWAAIEEWRGGAALQDDASLVALEISTA